MWKAKSYLFTVIPPEAEPRILKTNLTYAIMPTGKKRSERLVHAGRQRKAPMFQHRGFSIPNFGNGRA